MVLVEWKEGEEGGGVTDIASLKAVKTFASSIKQSRLGGRECKLCWTKLSEGAIMQDSVGKAVVAIKSLQL